MCVGGGSVPSIPPPPPPAPIPEQAKQPKRSDARVSAAGDDQRRVAGQNSGRGSSASFATAGLEPATTTKKKLTGA